MRAIKAALRPLWWTAARRAARAYVAGEVVQDAVRVCRRWRSRGVLTTLGYWNVGGEDFEEVGRQNRLCLEALERFVPDGYLSLKLGAFGYREDLLRPLLEHARAGGFGVHFDALGPETVDRTNAEIDRALVIHPDLGCTLPGRWRRSLEDAEWAIDRGLTVRVVKGQWPDPDVPDRAPRAGFLAVVRRLAGRARRVAIATHDVALAQACAERLLRAGTPADLELLHGLPMRRALKAARRLDLPVRIYVPYGASFLPYTLEYVRRHPQVAFFLARDALGG